MKIKTFICVCILCTGMLQIAHSATRCECGTHATGITAYSVNGPSCCLSVADAAAFEYTYTQQEGGVWEVTGTTSITGSAAQATCCPTP